MIKTLKDSVNKIERVVIPLLHHNEEIFLSNIYKALGESRLAKLVSDPRGFFGRETQVIKVSSDPENKFVEREPVNVSETHGQDREIQSGTPLIMNDLDDWVYIPFNYEHQSLREEFLKKLKEKDVNIDKLKNDSEYILEKESMDKIKIVYKSLSGNINQNSMFLYSGPSSKKVSNRHYWRGRYWNQDPYCCCWCFDRYIYRCDPDRVACLYTGDGDLNKVRVKDTYKRYWNLIGTIQIPHHGSYSSFDATVLEDNNFLCPISVGKNNSYGHPSWKVIGKIISSYSYPILVTEDANSALIEIIEIIEH